MLLEVGTGVIYLDKVSSLKTNDTQKLVVCTICN